MIALDERGVFFVCIVYDGFQFWRLKGYHSFLRNRNSFVWAWTKAMLGTYISFLRLYIQFYDDGRQVQMLINFRTFLIPAAWSFCCFDSATHACNRSSVSCRLAEGRESCFGQPRFRAAQGTVPSPSFPSPKGKDTEPLFKTRRKHIRGSPVFRCHQTASALICLVYHYLCFFVWFPYLGSYCAMPIRSDWSLAREGT